jgi:hypothetical protein
MISTRSLRDLLDPGTTTTVLSIIDNDVDRPTLRTERRPH